MITAGTPISWSVVSTCSRDSISAPRGMRIPSSSATSSVRRLSSATARLSSRARASATTRSTSSRRRRRASIVPSWQVISARGRCSAQTPSSSSTYVRALSATSVTTSGIVRPARVSAGRVRIRVHGADPDATAAKFANRDERRPLGRISDQDAVAHPAVIGHARLPHEQWHRNCSRSLHGRRDSHGRSRCTPARTVRPAARKRKSTKTRGLPTKEMGGDSNADTAGATAPNRPDFSVPLH